jgi:hypothetical protein
MQQGDVKDYSQKARDQLPADPYLPLTGAMVDSIEAIAAADIDRANSSIQNVINDYHTEHVAENVEEFDLIERTYSYEATGLVALAREQGLDLHVDSRCIPDAVYKEEHYPLGGN